MSEVSDRPKFPKWWYDRIESDLADFNPRLIVRQDERRAEQKSRADREIQGLKTDTSHLHTSPDHLALQNRINDQVDKQSDLIRSLLMDVYEIEELNNHIVYDLGGHVLTQLQGGVTGEVRVRIISEIRAMQQHRRRLEDRVLEMWEHLGDGYKDSQHGL